MKAVDPRLMTSSGSTFQGLESRCGATRFPTVPPGDAIRECDCFFAFLIEKGSIKGSFNSSYTHQAIILDIDIVRVVQTPHDTCS